MVINISILKVFIQQVLGQLDHKNLDVDVAYFHNVIRLATPCAITALRFGFKPFLWS